jgi:hypothetical protein
MDLALRSNQLLPEQAVFGQEGGTAADEVSDQSEANREKSILLAATRLG